MSGDESLLCLFFIAFILPPSSEFLCWRAQFLPFSFFLAFDELVSKYLMMSSWRGGASEEDCAAQSNRSQVDGDLREAKRSGEVLMGGEATKLERKGNDRTHKMCNELLSGHRTLTHSWKKWKGIFWMNFTHVRAMKFSCVDLLFTAHFFAYPQTLREFSSSLTSTPAKPR